MINIDTNKSQNNYSRKNIPINKEVFKKYSNVRKIFDNEMNNCNKIVVLNYKITELKTSNLNQINISDLKKLTHKIFYKYNTTNIFKNNQNIIIITKSGLNESIEKIFYNYSQRKLLKEHLIILANIGNLLKYAKLVNQTANVKNKPDINYWNYFICKLNIQRNIYIVIFDVRSMQDGQNQYRVQRIEKIT